MRFLSSILAFVLGLAALGAGIGQLTVWAPETSTVVQSDELEDQAPLTIITEDVVDPEEERDTFTIEAEASTPSRWPACMTSRHGSATPPMCASTA